jgi:adenylate kinase family enzyme
MTAVLLTGMSGVGKSTVLRELAARGILTVDTDYGDWIEAIDGERLWREGAIGSLLAAEAEIVIAGTVANQGRFYDRFDAIVLLTVPAEEALRRIAARTTNDWGKRPEEEVAVLHDFAEVEPLLRSGATHVLDGQRPVAETADAVVALLRSD